MSRFTVSTLDGSSWVWDNQMGTPVSNPVLFEGFQIRWLFDSDKDAQKIADVLNQRVERPELTNANGSMVSVSA